MTIRILDLDKPLANVELVNGKLKITVLNGNDWVLQLIEELRLQWTDDGPAPDLTDQELFDQLVFRLRGQIWAGVVDETELPPETDKGGKRWIIEERHGVFVAIRPVYAGKIMGDATLELAEGEPFRNIPYAALRNGMVLEEAANGDLTEVPFEQLVKELDELVESFGDEE